MSDPVPPLLECSRAGCRAAATAAVHWRNPRIHGRDRVKTWLACPDHEADLAGHLTSRGFPVVVTPVGETVAVVPDGAR